MLLRHSDPGRRGLRLLWPNLLLLAMIAGLPFLSAAPSATAPLPRAPSKLRAVAVTTNEVDLSWEFPGGDAASFVINRNGADIATVGAATLMYVDTAVQPGTDYQYTVVATDATGAKGPPSNRAKVKTPSRPDLPDLFAPTEPEDFSVVSTADGFILLDWSDALDDTDITAYRIYRDGRLLVTVDSGTLSYLDTTVEPGVTYTYTIEALDPLGKRSKPVQGKGAPKPHSSQGQGTAPAANATTIEPTASLQATVNPALRRYPYLTDAVGQYLMVNWATDRSGSTGSVKWGTVNADGSCTPSNSASATKSSITVNSVGLYQWKAPLTLEAGKQYCYRIFLGSVDLLGSDPSPRFHTQVPAGSTEAFSFAVIGDWGSVDSTGANPDQANVMQRIASSGARFVLTTGDNAYPAGSQTNYGDLVQVGSSTSAVFGPQFWAVPGRSIPTFVVNGNHDMSSTANPHPYLVSWPQDRAVATSIGKYVRETYCCLNGTTSASYPSAWYAFDAGNVRFYVLQASWPGNNIGTADQYENDFDYHWTTSSPEYQWLEQDLQANQGKLKIAVLHYPFYSDNSSQDSDTFLQGNGSLEGLLGRNGVVLAFSGHAHIYQRDKPNTWGTITYVTGGGGAKLATTRACTAMTAYSIGWSYTDNAGTACGSAPRPSSIDHVFHFLAVTVNGNTVTVTPTDEMGRTFDVKSYTFSGGGVDTTPPSAPASLAATAASSTQVDLSWTASTDNVGVDSYLIIRDGTQIALTSGTATTYSDTTVAPGTSYQYVVKARDAAGNISSPSNTATVTTPGATTSLTFAPEADAYVEEANPGTNFGTVTKLLTDGSPNRRAYLRFTVSGLSGSVQSAKLRLFVTDGTTNGPKIYATASNDWSETGLTWSNQPGPAGSALGDTASASAGVWVEYDVTAAVQGNGTFSFELIPDSSNGLDVYAREGSQPPQLVVTPAGP